MYAITGITGKVGGVVAPPLAVRGSTRPRAVARGCAQGLGSGPILGCEVATPPQWRDAAALTRAFTGVTGGLHPALLRNFDPEPWISGGQGPVISVVASGARCGPGPAKVVCLATIGGAGGEVRIC